MYSTLSNTYKLSDTKIPPLTGFPHKGGLISSDNKSGQVVETGGDASFNFVACNTLTPNNLSSATIPSSNIKFQCSDSKQLPDQSRFTCVKPGTTTPAQCCTNSDNNTIVKNNNGILECQTDSDPDKYSCSYDKKTGYCTPDSGQTQYNIPNWPPAKTGYCTPDSGQTQYNIRSYDTNPDFKSLGLTVEQAGKKDCDSTPGCVGFTVNYKNQYVLKTKIDDVEPSATSYKCYQRQDPTIRYIPGSEDDAKKACSSNPGCVGFTTYNNGYVLKRQIDGVESLATSYNCFQKTGKCTIDPTNGIPIDKCQPNCQSSNKSKWYCTDSSINKCQFLYQPYNDTSKDNEVDNCGRTQGSAKNPDWPSGPLRRYDTEMGCLRNCYNPQHQKGTRPGCTSGDIGYCNEISSNVGGDSNNTPTGTIPYIGKGQECGCPFAISSNQVNPYGGCADNGRYSDYDWTSAFKCAGDLKAQTRDGGGGSKCA